MNARAAQLAYRRRRFTPQAVVKDDGGDKGQAVRNIPAHPSAAHGYKQNSSAPAPCLRERRAKGAAAAEGTHTAVAGDIIAHSRQKYLRRSLYVGLPVCGSAGGVFFCTVERTARTHARQCADIPARIHYRTQKRAVGGVASHGTRSARFVHAGYRRCVETGGFAISPPEHSARTRKRRRAVGPYAVPGNDRAYRLYHAAYICRQNHRYHHGQSLGDRDHHNGQSECERGYQL